MNRTKSEADARVLIDRRLNKLGWENIWRETVPRAYQSKLGGAKPDYVLCLEGGEKPIAVVEAKRAGRDLTAALQQGREYAKKIGCAIIFASDGVLTLTAHVTDGKPLMINSEEVRDFLDEKVLRNFVHARIWERLDVIQSSRQLISIFNAASRLLRAEGMVNIDAFAEFSQILFFKIVSEIDDAQELKNLAIRWNDLEHCYGSHLLESYKSALSALAKKYPGVFSTHVEIKNPATLEKIIEKLSVYSFLEVKADIKGSAYEHFLRQYNRQKSELAQYFTPRHVVGMMVALADPKLGERVYDPFCGTGGMLLEAFRYLERNVKSNRRGDIDKLQKESVFGADISRSASAAKMNMILAGDGHSNIARTDSLRSDAKGKYDVVITNIPFVATDETAFVAHCLSACAGRAGGRVCMIVPERILDGSEYTGLREGILREWDIKRIISLPREVFRGITSAKTSVIYALWKDAPKPKAKRYFIPYMRVEDDGYTLDRRRDPLPGKNDLDHVIETRDVALDAKHGHYADAENDYSFKPIPARELIEAKHHSALLRDLVTVKNEKVIITSDMICLEPRMTAKDHRILLKEERFGYNVRVKTRKLIRPGDLVFAKLHTQNGLFAYSEETFHSTGTHLVCKVNETKVDRDFLFYALDKIVPSLSKEDTTGRENYSEDEILSLAIPLPPLQEQQAMVKRVKTARGNLERAVSEMADAKDSFWRLLSQS